MFRAPLCYLDWKGEWRCLVWKEAFCIVRRPLGWQRNQDSSLAWALILQRESVWFGKELWHHVQSLNQQTESHILTIHGLIKQKVLCKTVHEDATQGDIHPHIHKNTVMIFDFSKCGMSSSSAVSSSLDAEAEAIFYLHSFCCSSGGSVTWTMTTMWTRRLSSPCCRPSLRTATYMWASRAWTSPSLLTSCWRATKRYGASRWNQVLRVSPEISFSQWDWEIVWTGVYTTAHC